MPARQPRGDVTGTRTQLYIGFGWDSDRCNTLTIIPYNIDSHDPSALYDLLDSLAEPRGEGLNLPVEECY